VATSPPGLCCHATSGADNTIGAIYTHCKGAGLGHNLTKEARNWFKSPIAQTTHTTVSQAVQSNMVYLPRITFSLHAGFVARLINAKC